MSAGLKGNVDSLSKFSADLRRLPRVVGQLVAAKAAPVLTSLVKQTFDASEDAYGNLWAPGEDGQKVTLRKTGELERSTEYTSIGTKLRLLLSVPYAKYQVGKRPIAPRQGGKLPVAYSTALERVAIEVCREELGR